MSTERLRRGCSSRARGPIPERRGPDSAGRGPRDAVRGRQRPLQPFAVPGRVRARAALHHLQPPRDDGYVNVRAGERCVDPIQRGEAGGVNVVGYIRVSTAEQADSGAGLDAQRAAIALEAERRGWRLLEVFEDARGYRAGDCRERSPRRQEGRDSRKGARRKASSQSRARYVVICRGWM